MYLRNLLICCLFFTVLGCKKKSNTILNPQDYPHFTFQQIWDSIGFQFEKKYWTGAFYNDTIVVHSDYSVTEYCHTYYYGDSLKFQCYFSALDTAIDSTFVVNGDTSGTYKRRLFLKVSRLPDSQTANDFCFHYYLTSDTATINLYYQNNTTSGTYVPTWYFYSPLWMTGINYTAN